MSPENFDVCRPYALPCTDKKRPREQPDTKEFTTKRSKIYHGNSTFAGNSLLHLFVDFAWEAPYGECSMSHTEQLVYWISSRNIDFDSKDWHSPDSMANCEDKNQLFSAELAYTLRFILPTLMRSNGDVRYVDEFEQTILHVFLKNYMWTGQPRLESDLRLNKIVTALIAKGASIDHVDKFGNTPFSIAASGLRRDLCWLMLPHFNNVHACDKKGDTVLHKITSSSHFNTNVWCDIVKALLSKGADPNRKNNEGLTAVHLAAENGKNRILQFFAECNADFALRTTDGEKKFDDVIAGTNATSC